MMYILDSSIKEKGSSEINPGIDAIDIDNGKAYFRTDYYDEFIEPEPFFNDLKLYKRLPEDLEPTIFNDTHTWAGRSPAMTWTIPLSEPYKNLLEQYNLVGSKFYSGNLNFQGESFPYYVFHTLDNAWDNVLDLEKSVFLNFSGACNKKSVFEEIKINSVEDYRTKNDKQFMDNWEEYEIAHNIELSEVHLNQKVDLIFLPELRYCISERLKNAIESANISGVEITPITNVDFYYQEEKI